MLLLVTSLTFAGVQRNLIFKTNLLIHTTVCVCACVCMCIVMVLEKVMVTVTATLASKVIAVAHLKNR